VISFDSWKISRNWILEYEVVLDPYLNLIVGTVLGVSHHRSTVGRSFTSHRGLVYLEEVSKTSGVYH